MQKSMIIRGTKMQKTSGADADKCPDTKSIRFTWLQYLSMDTNLMFNRPGYCCIRAHIIFLPCPGASFYINERCGEQKSLQIIVQIIINL